MRLNKISLDFNSLSGLTVPLLPKGQEHQEPDRQAFRGNGKLSAEQAEIRRLKEENKRLKMEKEILKNNRKT